MATGLPKQITLYDLPPRMGVKIYIDDRVFIFDHLDGMYSYSYNKDNREEVIHLGTFTPLVKFKDGYKIREIKNVVD